MAGNGFKTFRDPIHDYILMPEALCKAFVDTKIFQRLRNIEQTSMRPLYPSARHDRFTHSLGVYHLAEQAAEYIVRNTDEALLEGVDVDACVDTFRVASLMHDCGHAPFSHTFEEYYNLENRAQNELLELVKTPFIEDFNLNYNLHLRGPSPHELVSAIVFLKHYSKAFTKLYPRRKPELVARMITGCLHQPPRLTNQKKIENCFILLLHGNAIDVDKLDYIVRDTWASGVNNTSLDVNRLLSSLAIVEHNRNLYPGFRRSALSVIQSVVDARNYLHNWIYCHHTVCYYAEILETSVKRLLHGISPKADRDALIRAVFSVEAFDPGVTVGGVNVYLPCDGDIIYLLKQHRNKLGSVKDDIEELLERRPSRIPLWKTRAEFELIFEKTQDPKTRAKIAKNVQKILKEKNAISESGYGNRVRVIEVEPKTLEIRPSEVYVSIRGQVMPFTEIPIHEGVAPRAAGNGGGMTYFYVFIPKECEKRKSKCIRALQDHGFY